MHLYTLERTQIVPSTLDTVWEFFSDPRNLGEITPPWLRFRIVRSSDERVQRGTRIVYRIGWFGLPMRWESLIAEYDAPRLFADEMVRGPYARWYHRHLFREVEGGVELRDHVEYAMPLGVFGRMGHALVVRRQLDAIFRYRHRVIRERFGAVRAVAEDDTSVQ